MGRRHCWVCLFLTSLFVRLGAAEPDVAMCLAQTEVFKGEGPPLIRIVVSAPPENAVRVLRSERVSQIWYLLGIMMYGPDGSELCEEADIHGNVDYKFVDDDFVMLAPGKRAEYTADYSAFPIEGTNMFHVRFRPSGPKAKVFESKLNFACIAIAKDKIVHHVSIPAPNDAGGMIEVMNVRTGEKHELIHRWSILVRRLGEIDADSKIEVKPKHFYYDPNWQTRNEMMIKYKKESRDVFLKCDYLGSIKERGILEKTP